MKTSELTGMWLAHWVALAEGLEPQNFTHEGQQWVRCRGDLTPYEPHEKWSQGGPIIERERIALVCFRPRTNSDEGKHWDAYIDGRYTGPDGQVEGVGDIHEGPTALIAAMRANVARVYGNEVPDPP